MTWSYAQIAIVTVLVAACWTLTVWIVDAILGALSRERAKG